jgi:glycosyltransferase involved in cell wall biosynthesis
MKILLCHNHYSQPGGESEVFANEVRGLRERGHELIIYTRGNDEIAKSSVGSKLELLFSAYHSRRTQRELQAIIRAKSPDVAYVQNVFPLLSPSVYTTLAQARVPTVQAVYNYRFICPSAELYTEGAICERCVSGNTFHAALHRCYRDSYSQSSWYASIIGFHRKRSTFSGDIASFMVPDEFLGVKLAQGGIPSRKIWSNPNPFFVHDYRPMHSHKGFVLFVGRLTPQKGIIALLDAMNRSAPASRLVVVGQGPLLRQVQELSGAHALRDRVTVLGPLWGSELDLLLQECAAVVIPSEWYDNLPLILCKANATGKPVLVSRLDGLPEYVHEGLNGYTFEPANVVEMAARIDGILGMSAPEYLNLSNKARLYAEKSLDYPIHYTNLMAEFEKLVTLR